MLLVAAGRSPSFVEQFWPIVAAGAFGITGALLGKAFERRHSYEAWRRDRRLSAYGDLLESLYAWWVVALYIYRHRVESGERFAELHEREQAFNRSLARLGILGTVQVYERGRELREAIHEISELVTTSPIDNSTPLLQSPLGRALSVAHDGYVAAAMSAIGADRS